MARRPPGAARLAAYPELVERELDEAVRHAALFGPDDETKRGEYVRSLASTVLGKAVQTRLADDPGAARVLLDRWGGFFHDPERGRLDAEIGEALRGRRIDQAGAALRDPGFAARHGLSPDDAAHLGDRLAVAFAASRRNHAREQEQGAQRETERFWELAQDDPAGALDHLRRAKHLSGEQAQRFREALLDQTRDWQSPPAAPGAEHPGVTEPVAPVPAPAAPGDPAAQASAPVAPAPAEPAAPASDSHEDWRLRQLGADKPQALRERDYDHDIVPDVEIVQQENIRALIDQMARLKFPETGDLNRDVHAQREEYRQQLQRTFVSEMVLGRDARKAVWAELEGVESRRRPDPALVNAALTPQAGIDPQTLANAVSNDEKSLGQYTRDRGRMQDDIHALWNKRRNKTITDEENDRLERLERDLPPEVKAKNAMDWLITVANEEFQDKADKAGRVAAAGGLGIVGSAAVQREFETSAGKYYKEFSTMRDKNGEAMPEEMAQIGALLGGLMHSGLEVLEYAGLGAVLGSGAKVGGKAAAAALKEALKKPENFKVIAEGAVKAGKALGISSLKNLGESTIQHYYSKVVGKASNLVGKTDFEAEVKSDDVIEIINDAAGKTFTGGAKRALVK